MENDTVSTLTPDAMQSLKSELPSLRQREACATTAAERRRWQALVLIASGQTRREICATLGYSQRTLRHILQRYRSKGAAALTDGRHASPARSLLTDAQQQALQLALQHPPPAGGKWTGPKVARWMSAVTGKPVHRQRGWEYLQRFGPERSRHDQ